MNSLAVIGADRRGVFRANDYHFVERWIRLINPVDGMMHAGAELTGLGDTNIRAHYFISSP